MRPMLRSSSWLNETPLCRTAVNILMGIAIIPKLIVPLQIDLAIGDRRYRFGLAADPTWRSCSVREMARERGSGVIVEPGTAASCHVAADSASNESVKHSA